MEYDRTQHRMISFLKKYYGLGGLLLLAGMEMTALLDIPYANIWITPAGWYGYILMADWLVLKREKVSPLTGDTKKFLLMFPLSILIWGLFEMHNLLFHNWEYIWLPDSMFLTSAGFIISFSTILPAIYVTAVLLKSFRFTDIKVRPHGFFRSRAILEVFAGLVLISVTILYPSRYTGPLLWGGYLLFFPPLNSLAGIPSVLDERKKGSIQGIVSLVAAGYICGLIWEFLNFWAGAKWVYHVPYLSHVRIFEMPVIGFLGFGPFAVIMMEMYSFITHLPEKIIS